ncbi:MFS transporter [Flavihumibacter sp. UBA7668]|uniref:MFS transporter n=1 Tax=Flavihumibacter sp. UBA7668 TaxID=1946542 RepID=UPI0025B8DF7B|nr:MFS transporter [Flavihumibacter sp. UBA7668]
MQQEKISTSYWLLFLICFLSSIIGGTVSTLMAVYLPIVVKELNLPADVLSNIGAYINALFIYGWAIGGFSWGLISDRIGRKKALLAAISCYGLATIATGFQQSWEGLVLFRFISGFGVGGVLVISFSWLSEIWPSTSRSITIGILSIGIPVGIFSAGLINFFISSWRDGFLIGVLPLLLALIGIWLIKVPDYRASYNKSHNEIQMHHIGFFSEETRANLLTGSLLFSSMLIGLWAIFSWLPTWIQGLVPGTNAQKERGLSMMLMGIGGLTGGFFSGWIVNALGIRKTMAICFGMCTILSFVLFRSNSSFHTIVLVEIGLLAFFFGVSQGALSVYIPQLFPSVIRASSAGFCFNIGRLFTATAVLFVGILVSGLGGYGNAIFLFSLTFPLGWLVLASGRKKINNTTTIQPANP